MNAANEAQKLAEQKIKEANDQNREKDEWNLPNYWFTKKLLLAIYTFFFLPVQLL